MHYLVSGATSGTGHAVVDRLIKKVGLENITCIVRPTSKVGYLQLRGVNLYRADISAPESYRYLMGPSVVYIDMTHPRYYQCSLDAFTSAGGERAYFITTTGIFSKYQRCAGIYVKNEDRIRRSGIVYTIIRPSMIYGSVRDKNMHKLIRFLDRHLIFPVFGNGRSLMQPVFVDDLADGIVAAIGESCTEYQEYNLAGPCPVSYIEIIDTILQKLGRRVRKINIHAGMAQKLVRMFQRLPKFPINDEQVLRLQEDKVFDITAAGRDLGYSPRSFEEGIGEEIKVMAAGGFLRSAPVQ